MLKNITQDISQKKAPVSGAIVFIFLVQFIWNDHLKLRDPHKELLFVNQTLH